MAEYGIPYMGSKSSICNELIKIFPSAENFYDLFGGGFSVTHAMLLRRPKDFKCFHFNEIRPGICELIKRAISGEYAYKNFKPPFVSHNEFAERKEKDPYIKIIWSFGNNGRNYLFSKEIEPYKRSLHNAIIFNKFDEVAIKVLGIEKFNENYSIKDRRLFLRNRAAIINKRSDLEQLERLERLEQLEQLERLQQLQQLQFYSQSYDKISIKPNSVIYCDPPYNNTAKYDGEFNHKKFYDWCDKQENPVFISEYLIPDKRFVPIFKIAKQSLLSSNSRELKQEKVFINKYGFEFLKNRKAVRNGAA